MNPYELMNQESGFVGFVMCLGLISNLNCRLNCRQVQRLSYLRLGFKLGRRIAPLVLLPLGELELSKLSNWVCRLFDWLLFWCACTSIFRITVTWQHTTGSGPR